MTEADAPPSVPSEADVLLSGSAVEIALELREGRTTAVQMVEAAIARIERLDREINAVVVRDFDRARDDAKAADRALANGQPGALLGVPMTVKEAHDVAGLAKTWGTPLFSGRTATADSAAVKRLRNAGAILLGKTNVPPFLADWQSANSLHGRTSNPWDLSRTPGGSSGGSAAALAAGMVPLELGTDLGGSIRIPAAFCGVFGHKPTYGLVPMRGAGPPGVDGVSPPLAVTGPMARCAADLELAMEVLAGPDEAEQTAYRLTLPAPRHERLEHFRVFVLDRHPFAALDAEIGAALANLGDRLASRGAEISRESPLLPDLGAQLECFVAMLQTVVSRGNPAAPPAMSAHQWMDVLDTQLAFRRSWAEFYRAFDVVIAPAFGCVAFPHDDEEDMGRRKLVINGEGTAYAHQGAWSSMASVANLPATVAPIALSSGGLPIGVQIIGPYLEDRTTIGFAALLERELEAKFRAPKLFVGSRDGAFRSSIR